MAASDYWKCEACGCKAFYDANISWESTGVGYRSGMPRPMDGWEYGEELALMALCDGCAQTHELRLVKREV